MTSQLTLERVNYFTDPEIESIDSYMFFSISQYLKPTNPALTSIVRQVTQQQQQSKEDDESMIATNGDDNSKDQTQICFDDEYFEKIFATEQPIYESGVVYNQESVRQKQIFEVNNMKIEEESDDEDIFLESEEGDDQRVGEEIKRQTQNNNNNNCLPREIPEEESTNNTLYSNNVKSESKLPQQKKCANQSSNKQTKANNNNNNISQKSKRISKQQNTKFECAEKKSDVDESKLGKHVPKIFFNAFRTYIKMNRTQVNQCCEDMNIKPKFLFSQLNLTCESLKTFRKIMSNPTMLTSNHKDLTKAHKIIRIFSFKFLKEESFQWFSQNRKVVHKYQIFNYRHQIERGLRDPVNFTFLKD